MPRPQVRDVSPARAIQPQAAPVDTFVRTADPAPSSLHDLAKGLASLDSGLGAYMEKRQKKLDEADKIRGQAAFYRNNQTEYAEAVRQGLIPANSSPVFMESYKGSQGNLAGIRLREQFNQAYLQWDGRNSDDPELFQTFLNTFISENVQTDDPDILRGLMPHLDALTNDAMSTWSKERADAAYNGSVATRGAVAGETIDYASTTGIASEKGTDYDALWEDLLAGREEALSSGIKQSDYDKQLVDAIVDKAIEHGDPMLLEMLDRTLPGSDVKLSSLPEFRDMKANGMAELERMNRQRMTDRDSKQADEDKRREREIQVTIMRGLAENPLAEVPEELIKEWEKYDGGARTKLEAARKTLLDATEIEDPRNLLAVERMIQDGATTEDILELVRDGIIKDPQTLKTAIDRVEKRQKALREGQGILTNQTTKRITDTLRQRTMPDDITGMFDPGGVSDEGLEAIRDFENMLLEWETQNPNATAIEREEQINKVGKLILERVNTDERSYTSYADEEQAKQTAAREEAAAAQAAEDTVMGQEVSPAKGPDEARRRTFKETMEIDAGMGRPREADTEAYSKWSEGETKRLYSGDQPPSLDDMDASYRRRIEDRAAEVNMTPEEYNMELWKRLKAALGIQTETPEGPQTPDGTPVEKSSLQTDIGSTIDQAVEEGRQPNSAYAPEYAAAAPILDLIGHTEGTDKGRGYNETLAYGAYTGGDVDLVNMTLGEIDKLQTKMLRHPDNKLNSSAVGRYQVIRTTLRKLKKQMGLTDDMKFDKELQDRIALQLLKGRGLDKWLNGEMSDKAFQTNLAREWASLPKSGGGGYYKGQNAAVDPASVMSALTSVKESGDDPFKALLGDKPRGLAVLDRGGRERQVVAKADGNLEALLVIPERGYDPDISNVKPEVKDRLVAVQKAFGKQLVIVSGFRDPARNAKSKGAKKSQHMHGNAVDISVRDMSRDERIRLIKAASAAGFTGIGVYDNSLHFDTGGRRFWGPDYKGSSLPAWAKGAIQEHMNVRTA